MKTINLDRPWVKVLLVLAITAAALGLTMIFCTMAGCGAEIRPIQNHQPSTVQTEPPSDKGVFVTGGASAPYVPSAHPCCSASSCERMHK